MKRALIQRFLIILAITIGVFGVISYIVASRQMLKTTIENMRQLVREIDYAIDYSGDAEQQVLDMKQKIDRTTDQNSSKVRITILKDDGSVLADTDATDVSALENHGDREEIRQAFLKGFGYSTRYSNTLGERMLYVAELSEDGTHVIRVSILFSGITDYLKVLFPSLALAAVFLFILAMLVSVRFSDTVTKPLREIAEEMLHIQGDDPEFHFKTYRYEELNIISYTTDQLIIEIKGNIDRLEFERRVRQEFFSNASHELKTPITSVKGYAEILQNHLAKDPAAEEDCIRRIITEADHMTSLINDILMISKLETKDLSVDISEVRMAPLLSEVVESLQPIMKQQKVTVHMDCQPIVLQESANQMEELLTNLLTNAIKYNHPDGEVWVSISRENDSMVLTVRDNGIGIPEEDQERVFERFYRVDKGRDKKVGGTGLGLSIVKHIVGYRDGTITLKSKPGEGSLFTIRIPMEKDGQE